MTHFILSPMGTQFKNNYLDLKDWYNSPTRFPSQNLTGKIEIAGRYVTVSVAHLANSALLSTIGVIYDLSLSVIFFLADLLTCKNIETIHKNFIEFGSSISKFPLSLTLHLFSSFAAPLVYSCDEIIMEEYLASNNEHELFFSFLQATLVIAYLALNQTSISQNNN